MVIKIDSNSSYNDPPSVYNFKHGTGYTTKPVVWNLGNHVLTTINFENLIDI